MPTRSSLSRPRVPGYRRHKTGRAFVRIRGHNHYLGPYGSPESHEAYERVITEYLARRRKQAKKSLPDELAVASADLTVNEVALLYLRWAEGYYRKNGEPTGSLAMLKAAIRPLRLLHGHTLAREFGPLALKEVRESLIQRRCARKTCNDYADAIKRMFRWAVSEELVEETTYRKLKTVGGLREGRSEARETEGVRSVAVEVVERTLPFLSEQVSAMVRLQLLTGMRPGEVVQIRPCDADRSREVWEYVPATHKTQHRGKERRIFLGPRAQEVLQPWLDRPDSCCCFSPSEAEIVRNHDRRQRRKSPMTPSQRARARTSKRKRPPRQRFSVSSFRRAIMRACEIAFEMPKELRSISSTVEPRERERLKRQAAEWRAAHGWTPHQLRHTRATEIRREHGIESANVILGHGRIETTEIYAERDWKRAAEVMRKIG